jgi:hypothetical protein
MATVNKNFKIKHGLVVEGTTGTINGEDILTKKQEDIDYILAEVGGSGVSENTPDTLVLRDEAGSFAAQTVTVETLNVSGVGTISDDDELLIAASEGEDIRLTADDIRLEATDDVRLTAGTEGEVVLTADSGNIRLEGPNIYAGENLSYVDSEKVATRGYVDDAIGNIDLTYTTDDVTEGTNLYFTDTRAREAVSAGDGLDYNSTSGVFSADLGNGLQIDGTGQIEIDSNVVATKTDLSTDIGAHSDATSGVHGVTGDVVGTVDAQTLTNKDLGSGTTLSANLDANGFTVTGLATPTNGTDAVTKQYVDGLSSGLTWKAAVNLLSSTNVSLTGTDGTLVIDGHSALDSNDVGYRLLLTGQTDSTENGIYDYTVSGGSYTLTRSADADSDAELHGAAVFVMEGTTYGSTSWIQVNHYVTSFANQEWDQFSGAGTYIAGNGLSLTGNEFSIDTAVTATKSYVDEEIDAHTDLTTAHGVAGNIVGTSDTQTLTNKTLGSGTVLGADLDGTNTYKVVNLVDPTSNQDAATKKYVDDEITSVSGTIDNLTTTDVAEGDNLYFTDIRAKGSAADLIVNAIKTNITITGNEDGLTITAENGVADSTTSDLAEGTNQYFTEGRAKDAVAAALGDGIEYQSGSFNVQIATGLVLGGGTGNQIEIDRTEVDTWYDANGAAATAQEAAEDYADGLAGNYEVAGAAAAAQAAAEGYADGLAANYDPAGSATTAESNANSYTDSLIGDATVDGTSGNTVTDRIASAVSNLVDSAPATLDTLNELAAALQDNPDIISDLQDVAAGKQNTLTAGSNIDITSDTISVTGLDTDDVAEGANLYFTDARAVDALEAVVPNFTEVDINSLATQVAATASATASTSNTVYSFAKSDYRSAKFLVKVAYGVHTEISEILLTLDTNDNIAITEYAIVGTNGSMSTVSAEVSGSNVNLLVNPTNTSTVNVMGTLLA